MNSDRIIGIIRDNNIMRLIEFISDLEFRKVVPLLNLS